ncbi:sulfotransferase family protein [Mesorhizobium sp. M0520]|uniref:sulfotransferase family protein n=2 Tax=unclassified Mesorhizobium TaxID=325217 RepID=UPI0033368E3B
MRTCPRCKLTGHWTSPTLRETDCGWCSRKTDLTAVGLNGGTMTIRVIGAGFGRTGTDSMREALTILGFGPCHHMFEVMANEDQKRLWRSLAKGAAPDWNQLFAGYASCIDSPSAHYWRDLIDFYPDALVILTYRSPEAGGKASRKRSWQLSARARIRSHWVLRWSPGRSSAAGRTIAPMP